MGKAYLSIFHTQFFFPLSRQSSRCLAWSFQAATIDGCGCYRPLFQRHYAIVSHSVKIGCRAVLSRLFPQPIPVLRHLYVRPYPHHRFISSSFKRAVRCFLRCPRCTCGPPSSVRPAQSAFGQTLSIIAPCRDSGYDSPPNPVTSIPANLVRELRTTSLPLQKLCSSRSADPAFPCSPHTWTLISVQCHWFTGLPPSIVKRRRMRNEHQQHPSDQRNRSATTEPFYLHHADI